MARITTDQRIQTLSLLVLAACAVGAALYWLKPVMIPFVIAVFLMLTINPVVDWITRKIPAIPRWLAMSVVFLIIAAMFPILAGVVSASISEFADRGDDFQRGITQIVTDGLTWMNLERFGISEAQVQDSITSIPVATYFVDFTSSILNVLSNAVLVGVFLLFLLLGSQHQRGHELPVIWVQIQQKVQRYLIAKFGVSATTGVVIGLLLWALGAPLPGLFGFLTFILNFIPSVGSIIATLLPIPILLIDPNATALQVLLVLVIPGGAQFTIGNIIEPKILGMSLDLHPAVILLGLIFWGTLWGFVGMLLATPMIATVKILLEQYEITRPLAMLMAGRMDDIAEAISVDPATPIPEVPPEDRTAAN